MELRHTIFDNVHGNIHISDLELELINSEEFQRLRNIRQLGLLEYVFPGATHNRFSHSLGVLHIADKMFRSLCKKEEFKQDFCADEEYTHTKIRIAALLHDIGHYPWSHLIENVVIEDVKKR